MEKRMSDSMGLLGGMRRRPSGRGGWVGKVVRGVVVTAWLGAGVAPVAAQTNECTISGAAGLSGGDFVTGEITGSLTGATGTWMHDPPGEDELVITSIDHVFCTHDGDFVGDFSGSATWNGEGGYVYFATVDDARGFTTITETLTATHTVTPSEWNDGTILLDEEATVVIPETLEVTDGYASQGWAWLTMTRVGSEDRVVCRYRANGDTFDLQRCTGEAEGTAQVEAGSTVQVSELTLHVQNTVPQAELTLQASLEVTRPEPTSVPDSMSAIVCVPNDIGSECEPGTIVFQVSATVVTGDLEVVRH